MPVLTLLALFVAIIGIGSSAIIVRFSGAPALALAFYRLAITVLIFLVPVLLREREAIKRLSRRDWLVLLGSGLSLALHLYSWIESLRYTTVASSTVLVTSSPFAVLLLGYWLLGERTTRLGVLAMVIGVAGGIIVGWGDFQVGGTALYGDLLAILGAITVSGYMIAGRVARQHMSATLYSTVVYAFAAAFLLLLMLPQGVPLTPYPAREWMLFVASAVLPTVFGHTLLNWALKDLSASAVAMATLGEPVVATVLAWALFSELPEWSTVFGGLLLLAGIWLFIRYGSRPAEGTRAAA